MQRPMTSLLIVTMSTCALAFLTGASPLARAIGEAEAVAEDQQAPGTGAPAPPAPAGEAGPGRGGRGAGGGRGGASFGTDQEAELLFEERWTRAPLAQPMTQANLGNQNLRLHLYGDVEGIRKTFHTTEDYTYTGETRNTWMITVSDPENDFDLSLPGKVMLRTRNTGLRLTHVVVRTTDGSFYVSEEGSGESRAWMSRDYILADLHWRNLAMDDRPTTVNPNRPADPARHVIVATSRATPDLAHVREVGFTDLLPGGFIPATTRVQSWAVYGKRVTR
jgi:hypothetical protein